MEQIARLMWTSFWTLGFLPVCATVWQGLLRLLYMAILGGGHWVLFSIGASRPLPFLFPLHSKLAAARTRDQPGFPFTEQSVVCWDVHLRWPFTNFLARDFLRTSSATLPIVALLLFDAGYLRILGNVDSSFELERMISDYFPDGIMLTAMQCHCPCCWILPLLLDTRSANQQQMLPEIRYEPAICGSWLLFNRRNVLVTGHFITAYFPKLAMTNKQMKQCSPHY